MTNEEFKEKYYDLLDNQIDDRIKLNQALEKNAEIMQELIRTQKEYVIALVLINEYPDLNRRFQQMLEAEEATNIIKEGKNGNR